MGGTTCDWCRTVINVNDDTYRRRLGKKRWLDYCDIRCLNDDVRDKKWTIVTVYDRNGNSERIEPGDTVNLETQSTIRSQR